MIKNTDCIEIPSSSKPYKYWLIQQSNSIYGIYLYLVYFDDYEYYDYRHNSRDQIGLKVRKDNGNSETYEILIKNRMTPPKPFKLFSDGYNVDIWATSDNDKVCFSDKSFKENLTVGKNYLFVEDKVTFIKRFSDYCFKDSEQSQQPPTPDGGGGQNNGGQTNKPCSNTGQFGGGGTPLKDIKLFLYANNVTKGTIKLSKPQVEVGTFATDWRPNPSDYIKANSPAYKEVKGLAIQHNQNANKKYLEIETADGYAYGVDLWGGDAKKLLEQQQAEIEELKKMVQTLETKINV